MLSPPSIHSPRPRPPAPRRSTLPSPPPYESSLRSLSPLSDIWEADGVEGLSERLVRADTLRRERENELGHTSSACRSIYDNSRAIQIKHHSLLERISSPSTSPTPSTLPLLPFTLSISASPEDSLKPPPKPLYKRTLKVSHSDIAKLYEDNAQLIQKIESLEAEQSHEANQAGRSLRKLEDEITSLRQELENTRARSDELERLAQEHEHANNRRIRDETVQAARQKNRRDDWEIRDFAPQNPYVTPRSFSVPMRLSTRQSRSVSPSPPMKEQDLISQLLAKVNELEEANAAIRVKHQQTVQRLLAYQREAQNISLAYDVLDNSNSEFELELVSDDDEESTCSSAEMLPTPAPAHLHFRNYRKSIDLGSVASFDLEQEQSFDNGIRQVAQSTLRHQPFDEDILSHSLKHPSANRLRPSVMGLFEGFDRALTPPSPCPSPSLSVASFSTQGEPLRTLQSELGDEWDSSRPSNDTLHSRNRSIYEMSIFGGSPPSSPPKQPFLTLEPPTPDKFLEQQQQQSDNRRSLRRRANTNSFSFKRRRFTEEWSKEASVLRHSRGKSMIPDLISEEPEASKPADTTSTFKGGLANILLEFWLWLQFALIVLVFIWTMARKGPREVLIEVDRNNGRRVSQ